MCTFYKLLSNIEHIRCFFFMCVCVSPFRLLVSSKPTGSFRFNWGTCYLMSAPRRPTQRRRQWFFFSSAVAYEVRASSLAHFFAFVRFWPPSKPDSVRMFIRNCVGSWMLLFFSCICVPPFCALLCSYLFCMKSNIAAIRSWW